MGTSPPSFPLLPYKPLKVTLKGFGSIQCPLVGCLKSYFIGFLLAQSNPSPFLKVGISSCSRICPPIQPIHQGGEYILNGPSPLLFSTGGEPHGLCSEVDTVIDVPHLLLGHAVSYQFHCRLVHPRIRFTHATPAASAEHTFHLLLPMFGGM